MSLNIHTVRCAALFASTLQGSDRPSARLLQDAITQTVRRLGSRGCVAAVAQEFGDHPETAIPRMRWARDQADLLMTASAPPTRDEVERDRLRLAA
jgi:hypothetical protein